MKCYLEKIFTTHTDLLQNGGGGGGDAFVHFA